MHFKNYEYNAAVIMFLRKRVIKPQEKGAIKLDQMKVSVANTDSRISLQKILR